MEITKVALWREWDPTTVGYTTQTFSGTSGDPGTARHAHGSFPFSDRKKIEREGRQKLQFIFVNARTRVRSSQQR
ncbi:hypothetical protein CsSME_00024388 [Camellia sinensis var. sinensis]